MDQSKIKFEDLKENQVQYNKILEHNSFLLEQCKEQQKLSSELRLLLWSFTVMQKSNFFFELTGEKVKQMEVEMK